MEEKSKWSADLNPILLWVFWCYLSYIRLLVIWYYKLSDADKIQGFKNEVLDKYEAHKALHYVTQQLILVIVIMNC